MSNRLKIKGERLSRTASSGQSFYEQNTPYVRRLDENGSLINPITGAYVGYGQNRRTRRMGEARFLNNRRSADIQVVGARKFRKVLQRYYKKDGSIGVIKHWLED